jgi:ribosomal protein S18 acetylase RimI-like enzyme
MLEITTLTRDRWAELRDIRLTALQDSPESFLSTYGQEFEYNEDKWRAEFSRGDWHIGKIGGKAVSLLGTTRPPGMSPHQCDLEFLWVAPGHRGSRLAAQMVTGVLDRLYTAGLRTAFLWVLDDNEVAAQLYKRLGFVSTNYRQPLPGQDDRSEERLQLDLSDGPPGSATGT